MHKCDWIWENQPSLIFNTLRNLYWYDCNIRSGTYIGWVGWGGSKKRHTDTEAPIAQAICQTSHYTTKEDKANV